jgi:hypothetical protein
VTAASRRAAGTRSIWRAVKDLVAPHRADAVDAMADEFDE